MPARALVVVAVALGVVIGCSGVSTPSPDASPAAAGGTLRVLRATDDTDHFTEWDPERFIEALDPHFDLPHPSFYDTAELMRCCLARTLLSTNGRSAEEGGARFHPDAAEEQPEISADGQRWTFRIKPGLRYAPPLDDVEITSADYVRSLHRLMAPRGEEDTPFGAFVYADIVGAAEYLAGDAASISGLETPDDRTLVIRLNQPAGNLAARLAAGMVVPIPALPSDPAAPFGVATGHEQGFGGYFVSSGPYMFEGAEAVDFSLAPAERQGAAGVAPERLVLVRNPSWDRATDELRPARPDRIEIDVLATAGQAVAEIAAGNADLVVRTDLAAIEDLPRKGRIFVNQTWLWAGLGLNTAQPPLDDVHVRRALNHAADRAAWIEPLGGPLRVRVAHHLVPDPLLANLLLDYRPFGTADGRPDMDAARAEMAQSRHDSDGDGRCDSAACAAVRVVALDAPDIRAIAGQLASAASELGIEFAIEFLPGEELGAIVFDPTERAAIVMILGWGSDFLSPSNFFTGRYHSSVDDPSLVGASEADLREWGYTEAEPIDVDARIEACLPPVGAAQYECWAALDQYLTENVVPSIPYAVTVSVVLASERVIGYQWDELAGAPAYDHIELAPPN